MGRVLTEVATADPSASTPGKVDIVIPLFNHAAVLDRAVQSVLSQTVGDWRLFVVDDGSPDPWSLAIEDPRVQVHRQDNRGPGAARNAGAALGAAPVVAFLDADDEWEPNYLAEALAVLNAKPEIDAVSAAWSGPRVAPVADGAARVVTWRWSESMPPADLKARVDAMHTSATVVRRTVFERCGGFYQQGCTYGEDSYLWLAVAMTGQMARISTPLVRFHVDSSTLSVGRESSYPLPPLLTDPETFRANIGGRWDSYLRRYAKHYAQFTLTRSVREGAARQATAFLSSALPAQLGLSRADRFALRLACAGAAAKQVAKLLLRDRRRRQHP